MPSPGQITFYHPPGGPGVRVDSHVYTGYTVPPYYDSMIAKLITYGATRDIAIKRMARAGVEVDTTIPRVPYLETITGKDRKLVMVQRFIPEISAGDKRILVVDGEPVPWALAR